MTEEELQGTIIDQTEYSDEEMHALIDDTMTDFDDGDLVSGTVVRVERDEVLLDIGYKSEGVIPARELSIRKDANPSEIVNVGDEIEALVLQKEDKDGRLILSKKRAEYERAWSKIEEKFEGGENVGGEVIEVVKGGLIIDIGLRGFLPASLVDLRRVKDLTTYMGDRLEARVIEMDRNRNNVVLSRRVVLEEGRKHERAEILTKLQKGMRLPGTVSSIVDFGAFVDLGGIDGLVHISELSWSHVNHPSEVVKVGDSVEVEVLDVDMSRERISLGLKQTTDDPWKQLVKNFPVGSIIEGAVTKLVPFGAFVELGDGVEGLVHISEMAKGHVETPDQVTTVGTKVQVKVMDIDTERRRISLSMKAAAETLGFEIEIQGGTGEFEGEEGEEATEAAEGETEAAEATEGDVAADEDATEPAADEDAAEAAADEDAVTEAAADEDAVTEAAADEDASAEAVEIEETSDAEEAELAPAATEPDVAAAAVEDADAEDADNEAQEDAAVAEEIVEPATDSPEEAEDVAADDTVEAEDVVATEDDEVKDAD